MNQPYHCGAHEETVGDIAYGGDRNVGIECEERLEHVPVRVQFGGCRRAIHERFIVMGKSDQRSALRSPERKLA
jgi:hypothetical protein